MSQLNKGRLPGGTAKITMPQSQGARDIEAQFPGATVEFSDVATLFPVNLEHRTRRSVGILVSGIGR